MKMPDKKAVARIEKEVEKLCNEATAYVIIALATKHLNWGISICKTKQKNDFVEGMVIGSLEFINAHMCAKERGGGE